MSKKRLSPEQAISNNMKVLDKRGGRPGLDYRYKTAIAAKCQTGKHVLKTGLGGLGVGSMWFHSEKSHRQDAQWWDNLPIKQCCNFGIRDACVEEVNEEVPF